MILRKRRIAGGDLGGKCVVRQESALSNSAEVGMQVNSGNCRSNDNDSVEDKASVSKANNNDNKEGERPPLNSPQLKAMKISDKGQSSVLPLGDELGPKKTRRLRHSKEKKQENVSDRRTRQAKNNEEISRESTRSILCSTPMKSTGITLDQSHDCRTLSIMLSPISINTRPIEEKESPSLRCKEKVIDGCKEVHEETESSSRSDPLCPKRRTYSTKQVSRNLFSKASGTGNSSNENEDPYSLFSRPDKGESSGCRMKKAKPAKVKSNKSKKKPLKNEESNKNNEKEFLNWCQVFSKDLEEIAATELQTE